MKRKIRKFAEGKAVTTRSDDEIEFSSKNPYKQYPGEGWKEREKEQGEKNLESLKSFGRKIFGGGDDESKFKDLESVGGAGRRPRTIEEQIKGRPGREIEGKEFAPYRRTPEPKAEPKAETKTNSVDFSKYDTKSYTSEREGGGSTNTTGGGGRNNAPKADKKAAAPKKDVGEDAKPLPGVQKDKSEPKPLPGKRSDAKTEVTPYVAPKSNRYPAILEDNKTEEKTASEPAESGADKRKRLEAERKKQREGVLNPKKAESTSSDNKASESGANKPKKEEKRYGQGLTPYEKGRTLSEYSKMLGGGKKDKDEDAESKKRVDRVKTQLKKDRDYDITGAFNTFKKGGSVSSASSRGDGIAARGKTRGKIC